MGHIHEPVVSHQIIFKYLYWKPGTKEKIYYEDKFNTVSELGTYFKRFPSAGYLVGYGKTVPSVPWAFEASLIIEWTDQAAYVRKEFSNVQEFVQFLQDHPALARCVDYKRK